MSTGAPPDAFSADGQNWGFPTYAWDVMQQDNYAWWRARLGLMAQYFHAYPLQITCWTGFK
jgi:4-alpha-glucanotransferase